MPDFVKVILISMFTTSGTLAVAHGHGKALKGFTLFDILATFIAVTNRIH